MKILLYIVWTYIWIISLCIGGYLIEYKLQFTGSPYCLVYGVVAGLVYRSGADIINYMIKKRNKQKWPIS